MGYEFFGEKIIFPSALVPGILIMTSPKQICSSLSINIVNASFDHRYSPAVLQTEV